MDRVKAKQIKAGSGNSKVDDAQDAPPEPSLDSLVSPQALAQLQAELQNIRKSSQQNGYKQDILHQLAVDFEEGIQLMTDALSSASDEPIPRSAIGSTSELPSIKRNPTTADHSSEEQAANTQVDEMASN